MMAILYRCVRNMLTAAAMAGSLALESRAEPPPGETLVVRLVHPERQAAEVLRSFERAPAPHPAAALAAWKRATRQPGQLGKPLEAAIALFNPEMAREWAVFHGAELRLDLGGPAGKPRWRAFVPRDDGTVAALITTLRLSGGGQAPPLGDPGSEINVDRLGSGEGALAARFGETLIFGSSHDQLSLALGQLRGATGNSPLRAGAGNAEDLLFTGAMQRIDSGLIFVLDPERVAPAGDGALFWLRAGRLLCGLGCRRVRASVAVQGDRLALEMTTELDYRLRPQPPASQSAAVDPTWLQLVPGTGLLAVVSVAFEPTAQFWTAAFDLADQIDRLDPTRAELAPLRGRITLVATAAGVSLEADLWPHLKGITAAIMGDARQPGVPTGALLVLHIDGPAAAGRLASDVLPRLSTWLAHKKRLPARAGTADATNDRRPLATVQRRGVRVWSQGRDVLVAWGDDVDTACRALAGKPERSLAALCGGWKHAPQRFAAVWPARCWSPPASLAFASPAWRSLAEDPPVVWLGWTQQTSACDCVQWTGLRQRVRRFLDQVPGVGR
jgi:hypothetical protein